MTRRAVIAVSLVLWAGGLAGAQNTVSAKDLRELLGAQVKRFGNDGRLVALWPFKGAEELRAFEVSGDPAPTVAANSGLTLSGREKRAAVAAFRELVFQPPFRIKFDLRLAFPASTFMLVLKDAQRDGIATCCFANVQVYEDSADRFIGSYRVQHGEITPPKARKEYAKASFIVDRWTPVTVDVSAQGLKLALTGQSAWTDPGADHKAFSLEMGTRDGDVAIRNLEIDTAVVLDSIRKLVSATTAIERGGEVEERGDRSAAVWTLLTKEMASVPLSPACRSEFSALKPPASRHLGEALKALQQNRPFTALDSAKAVRKEAPSCGAAFWLEGVVRLATGDVDLALAALKVAADFSPALPEAWRDLGIVEAGQGNAEAAARCFDKLQELLPKDPWVHVYRVRHLLDVLGIEGAEKEVAAAREKRPKSAGLEQLATELSRLRSRPEWKQTFTASNAQYVVESDVSAKLCADLLKRLSRFRRFVEGAFPLPGKAGQPSTVWIFDSREAYALFGNTLDHHLQNTVGIYHPAIKTLLLVGRVSEVETQQTLFHEGFHQYLDTAVRRPPIWLNEGLAQYYETVTFDAAMKAAEGAILPNRLGDLRAYLQKQPPIGFRRLMLLPPDAFMDPELVSVHYAQSWAMVHFFKRAPNGTARGTFDRYAVQILKGQPSVAAFDATFGALADGGLDELEAAFAAYVRSL